LLDRADALGKDGRRILDLNNSVGGDCWSSAFIHVIVPTRTSDEALVELTDLLERHKQEIMAWEARHVVKPDTAEAAYDNRQSATRQVFFGRSAKKPAAGWLFWASWLGEAAYIAG
jgi:hypothetical protein